MLVCKAADQFHFHRFRFSFSIMRIRERKPPAADFSTSPSPSPSSSSFSSYTSSSITAANSLASSQDSSSSFSLSSTASPRCRGLDLLVKAIYQVDAGSVIGVPYIQRRVTIRRRRRTHLPGFDAFVFDGLRERRSGRISKKLNNSLKPKKGNDLVRLSSRIQDSVLQSWRRRSDPC